MIEHVLLQVANLAAARKFYVAALQPLGYKVVKEIEGVRVGFGAKVINQ